MAVKDPNYGLRNWVSGASDVWDSQYAGPILTEDYFEAEAAIPIIITNRGAIAYTSYTLNRTITANGAITAGNSLILFIGTTAATANDVTSVTDSLGNTWVKDHSSRAGGRTGDFWRVQSAVAGTPVITVNTANYVTSGLTLYEVQGLIASPFDAATSTGDATTTAHTSTVVNTTSNAVIFGAYSGDQPTATYTEGSGYANKQTAAPGDYFGAVSIAKVATSAGSNSPSVTSSSPGSGNMIAIAYKASGVSLPPETSPSNDVERVRSAYIGWKTRYLRADGAVIRPVNEGNGDTTNGYAPHLDVVSEGQAYALIFAVQFNEQDVFDLVENFNYNTMDRRNYVNGDIGSNPPSNHYNTMMYHYNPVNDTAFDWAAAFDADIDRAKALLWAHYRWGSGGTINYLTRALGILSDLVAYGLRQSAHDSRWYMVSGTGNLAPNNQPEMNNSYLDPAAFRLFAQYDTTNTAKWLSAVDSSYEIIRKTADAVLPNPAAPGNTQTTTAKLPANWVTMDFTTGVVTPLTASYRDTNYTYDAFRQTNRLLYDWEWYNEPLAKARLQDYKPFLSSYWTTNSRIEAEYFHDGSVKSAYEQRMFYYAAWQALTVDDPSNAIAAAIWAAKIAPNFYKYQSYNSYYDNSVDNTDNVSYYGQSWLIFDELDRTNQYKNYGQQQLKSHSTDVYKTQLTTQTSTYYIDGHTEFGGYTPGNLSNPSNVVDGSPTTFSTITEGEGSIYIAGTTAPSSGTAISSVRARIHNGTTYSGWIILTAPAGGFTWPYLRDDLAIHLGYNNPTLDYEIFDYVDYTPNDTGTLGSTFQNIGQIDIEVTHVIPSYVTRSHQTSTVKRSVASRSHSTSLVKRKVALVTHSTDTLKRKGGISLTHSTSVNKRAVLNRTHTTDVLKRKVFTRTHSTDTLLRKAYARTHTTDVFKRTLSNKTHTTDVLKRKLSTVAHSTSVNKTKVTTVSHSTSVNKRQANILRSHTTSVNKRQANIGRSHTTDVRKRTALFLSHSTDTLKRKTYTVAHTTNTLKRKAFVLSQSTDVLKRKAFLRTQTTDTVKRSSNVRTHSTDALKRSQKALSHSTSVATLSARRRNFIRNGSFEFDPLGTSVPTGTYAVYAGSTPLVVSDSLFGSQAAQITNASSVGGGGSAGGLYYFANALQELTTYTLSVWVKVISGTLQPVIYTELGTNGQTLTGYHTSAEGWFRVTHTVTTGAGRSSGNVYIRTVGTGQPDAVWIVDGFMMEEGPVATPYFDGDSINAGWRGVPHNSQSYSLSDVFTRTHSTDVALRSRPTVSHTTSINKRKAGNARTHTTSIVKRLQGFRTHTTDVLKSSRNLAEHSTDIFKRGAGDKFHVTDTLLRSRVAIDHSTDTTLRAVKSLQHTTSIVKRSQSVKTHTTSVVKRKVSLLAHTTSVVKRSAVAKVHSTDVLKRKAFTRVHSTSINKLKSGNIRSHSTNILKRKANILQHSTDTVLRLSRTRTHSTDVFARSAIGQTHTTDVNKRKANIPKTHSTDILKRKLFTKTHSTSVNKRKATLRTHTTSVLKRKAFTRTHSTSIVKRIEAQLAHSADTLLRAKVDESHSTDILKRGAEQLVHSTNTLKRKTQVLSHGTSTVKKRTFTTFHSTDVRIREFIRLTHSTDVSKAADTGKKHVLQGGVWVAKPVFVLLNGVWQEKPVYYFTGTQWVLTRYQ